MTAVMISIRPEWCEKILNGEKTMEVRKSRPKLEPPFKVYIYCTQPKKWRANNGLPERSDELVKTKSGKIRYGDVVPVDWPVTSLNGKVIAEFICDNIDEYSADEIAGFNDFEATLSGSCVSVNQALAYLAPKSESIWGVPNFYGWYISNLKVYEKPKSLRDFHHLEIKNGWYRKKPIERAPQSWCYVEEGQNARN